MLAAIIIIIVLAVVTFAVTIGPAMGDSYGGVTKSSIKREPLPASSSTHIDAWFRDDWDWIGTGQKTKDGLRYFEKKTGVQVYVVITPTMDGMTPEQYARNTYTEVFGNDEGHAVFLWYEPDDGTGNGSSQWETWLDVGSAAKSVIDDEATEIILDYFETYYYSDYSEDQMLNLMFTKSADRMMDVTTNPVIYIFIIAGLIVLIIVAFKVWSAVKKRKSQEREEAAKIINTPLEHLSIDDVLGKGDDTTP